MKLKQIVLAAVMLVGIIARSQDCTESLLADKPGKWKPGIQGSIHNISAPDLVKERAILLGLQKKASAAYTPLGIEITYSTSWYKDKELIYVADPYGLSMYLLRYRCEPDKPGFYVEYASPNNVTITANEVFSLNTLASAPLRADEFRGYLKLYRKPELRNGHYYIGEEWTDNHRIKEEIWLVTYGDELPFYILSRKEYLELTKKRIEKGIKEGDQYLGEYLNNVNEYLTHPESDLSQMAVCNFGEEERFKSFVEEGDRFAFYPVRPNMNYYKKGLAKSAPQFFCVEYKYAIGDEVAGKAIEGLRQAISLDHLKTLLGK